MLSKTIHGEKVFGINIDDKTRCAHYFSDLDIIALKFKCCEKWFPCFQCHLETVSHKPEVWTQKEFEKLVVLCGNCGNKLSANEYFSCASNCPQCSAKFNPGCAAHYHLYFET